MRCMAEFYMSLRREAVDPHPRNLNVLACVFDHFLHFRFFPRKLGVTEHALLDRRNAGGIANIGANMAINTLHSKLHMSVVRERDRLPGRSGTGAKSHKQSTARGMSQT